MKRSGGKWRWTVAAAALAMLVGCGGAGSGSESGKKGVRPDRDLVLAIRQAGQATASSVEVQPLRDPAVDGFLKQAGDLEAAQNFVDAIAAVDRALKLAPDAPEILQLKAELSIGLHRYADAEALARRSFELGPRLGSLCARNWQTVVETRRVAKDEASSASAKAQVAACKVPPRQRL
ncbi:MAG TPA: tetratricopeptide repeat protein [Tahibacter sp.]|uniref:tetratricopeptide repeat protein n=1 Tax=Tahibacter sp. TaxID=2056211 RepID=UPI002BE34AE6|nr:tetratricopeptide repeat protein [Tahibacter sp.]HSX59400.1 tetratricopeptide repeat protein [Tahibacter sp.]